MPFLSGSYKILRCLFGRSDDDKTNGASKSCAGKAAGSRQSGPKDTRSNEAFENQTPHEKPKSKCDRWLEDIENPRKRKATDNLEKDVCKSGKLSQHLDKHSSVAYQSKKFGADQDTARVLTSSKQCDRDLMPPPAIPDHHPLSFGIDKHARAMSLGSNDEFSDAQTRATDVESESDVQKIDRSLVAVELPIGFEGWEDNEQDLWLHINNRGREALLPKTWMLDFPTLPLNLFATQAGARPFINFHKSTEFRAIKAIQDLISTGQTLRDRKHAPNADYRHEPTIEKAANKYIKWSLKDVGISSKTCIPVHAIAARKQGENSSDVIRELAIKMHKLSARHRDECGILTSIESRSIIGKRDSQHESQPKSATVDVEHNLPIIYGMTIASSILGVFTLDSHTPPPRFVVRALSKNASGVDSSDEASDEEDNDADEDSGMRLIDYFDFSVTASDVWNAFVIAIVAMMVRKTLAEIYDLEQADEEPDFDESVMDSSLIDDTAGDVAQRDALQDTMNQHKGGVRKKSGGILGRKQDPDL